MYPPNWLTDAYTMRATDISCVIVVTAFVANFTRAVTLARHPDTGVNFCRFRHPDTGVYLRRLWFFSTTAVFFRNRCKG